jgi:hypothetical protein
MNRVVEATGRLNDVRAHVARHHLQRGVGQPADASMYAAADAVVLLMRHLLIALMLAATTVRRSRRSDRAAQPCAGQPIARRNGMSPPTSQNKENPAICGAFVSTATGIRTPVSAVRGRCPSPLDDGGAYGARIARLPWARAHEKAPPERGL